MAKKSTPAASHEAKPMEQVNHKNAITGTVAAEAISNQLKETSVKPTTTGNGKPEDSKVEKIKDPPNYTQAVVSTTPAVSKQASEVNPINHSTQHGISKGTSQALERTCQRYN
jgi:hypothetical protein